jgi:hypothetical protein
MKNKICLLFLIVFASSGLHAKTGFIGRRNEISMDAFSLAYMKEINFTYKFAISKHIVAFANYATASFSKDMKSVDNVGLTQYDEFGSTQYFTGYEYLSSGKTDFKSNTIGFGVLYSSPFNNMDLPVGSYTGIGILKSSGTMTDSYTTKEQYGGVTTPFKYDMSTWNFRCYYGKEIILTGMLSLDISLMAGFSFENYTLAEPTDVIPDSPYGHFPQVIFSGHNPKDYMEEDNYDYSGVSLTGTGDYSLISFYLMPSIRIGYIF